MNEPLGRLPPLNALRAFVAVARNRSFSRAAAELFVTPAAVSQQVKLLEDHLGVRLFLRTGKSLELTAEGERCLPDLTTAFRAIRSAVATVEGRPAERSLTVSVAPSFAAKWLVPRLASFQARHPALDVRVSASMHLVDFAAEGVDCAIRYGNGRYEGVRSEKLLSESVVPVVSPELLQAHGPLASPGDLRGLTLLHDDSPDLDPSCPDWTMWLRAAGAAGIDGARGLRFNQSSLVLEAAVAGRGVALAKARLAAADLAAGRLVDIFGAHHPVAFAYHFVTPARSARHPALDAFRSWLFAQVDGAT